MAEHIDVFISSTSRDLPSYREALIGIIQKLGMFPLGMENFQPTKNNALQVCYDELCKAEIFFGLYAFRYGSIAPADMSYRKQDGSTYRGDNIKGFTEWEYHWALERNIPMLLFVVRDDANWKASDIDGGDLGERLKDFKTLITGRHVVKYFMDERDFQVNASIALGHVKHSVEDELLSRRALVKPSPKAVKEAEEHALIASQRLQSQHEAKKQVKQVGVLPKRFDDDTFHDRIHQRTEITNNLLKGGLVSVYGKGGIGKTGLVCKVLGDVEKADNLLDGRVFLRAETGGGSITIERIVESFARILPDAKLPTGQESITLSHRQKSEALLEALQNGKYLLVIDNAESLQDEQSHKLRDEALEIFLETVLETGGNAALTVLLTGRLPIPFKNEVKAKERKIMLDEGLPLEDARTFLRQLDSQKRLPETEAVCDKLIDRVRAFPRALEAAVGWLDNNSTENLESLMAALPKDEELTRVLVEKAQDSLPEAFQKVIQAVALATIGMVGQGIPKETLEYLLAPFIEAKQIPALLNRLVQARFILFNDTTHSYSLHPYDREHSLQAIATGSEADVPKSPLAKLFRKIQIYTSTNPNNTISSWTYYRLNARMIEFYSKQRISNPKTLFDLQPQLRGYEHCFANEDYDTAARILAEIDFDFLLLWGHAELMVELHSRLQGLIADPQLAQSSAGNLGTAYRDTGQVEKAVTFYADALKMARSRKDRIGEAVWLGNLAFAYSNLGQIDKSIILLEQALVIDREIEDTEGEGIDLGNLGNAYYNLGQIEKATLFYKRYFSISIEINRKIDECRALECLGHAFLVQDRYAAAFDSYQASIVLADEIKSPTVQMSARSGLARVHLFSGQLRQAFETIRDACQYDVPEHNHAAATLCGIIALTAKRGVEAKEAFTEALHHANDILAKTANLYKALYYRAIAHLGALACGGEASHLEQARADIARAKSIFAGEGTIKEFKRLLEALNKAAGQNWDIGL